MLARYRYVIGELDAEEVIRVRAERLSMQDHFQCQRSLVLRKVGERGVLSK